MHAKKENPLEILIKNQAQAMMESPAKRKHSKRREKRVQSAK